MKSGSYGNRPSSPFIQQEIMYNAVNFNLKPCRFYSPSIIAVLIALLLPAAIIDGTSTTVMITENTPR